MFVVEVGPGQQVVERFRYTGIVVIDRDGEQDTGIGADEQAVGDEDGGALVAVAETVIVRQGIPNLPYFREERP